MPVITLGFQTVSKTEALLLEEGAKDEKWTLVGDARVKTATTPAVGIGPCVYKGLPDTKDGPITKALFLFNDMNDAVCAIVEGADANDLTLTIASFLDSYGASVSAMQAKRPSNGD